MSTSKFLENKVEEALQLLSAQNELMDKQLLLMEEFLARFANMQAEHNLAHYVQDAKAKDRQSAF